MMRNIGIIGLCLLFMLSGCLNAQVMKLKTAFEKDNNVTATYFEAIEHYKSLVKAYPKKIQLTSHGTTDSGQPLHTAVIDIDGDFNPKTIREKGKLVLFVNNAIHPGEPCGVDASMMFARDCMEDKKLQKFLKQTVIVIIPFYNIGGGLNRGSHSRANQVGPVAHGFRGNARNFDLNRDFVKCDTKNAQTFNQIYNQWLPEIFIDNHTSNGADYPYTITMIATQHNKLDKNLAAYMDGELMPWLYQEMDKRNWEMTPYVYARNTPAEGIRAFLDLPRYSSGYAALHNAISFMPEAHMLKPYKGRVESTYTYMMCMLEAMYDRHDAIKSVHQKAVQNTKEKSTFDLNWTMDSDNATTINFKGYEGKYKPSEVSGLDRLYYDHDAPYEKEIPYFKNYKTTLSVEKPVAYILPQAYAEIIERMDWNGVTMQRLTEDQTVEVEMYRIEDYETRKSPYEGHYLHYNVQVSKATQAWTYHEGDYIIYANQATNRYIVETLEPEAPDSFFAWNFFDGILMQKEHFSSYVFEDLAAEYLKKDAALRAALEAKKASDEEFAKSAYAQLNFVYERSPHFEPTYKLYPVGRMLAKQPLKVQ